jgi:glycosyltransferase involved in cell wall biosynthesis
MVGERGGGPFRKLSVFFPMWNEEAYIERALDAAATECRRLIDAGEILDYELIVVDDASTDHTGKIADEMAAADPRVRVGHHPVNRKLGGSMKTGFAAATGDLVLYSDADLPFDMTEVSRAVHLMRYYEADIVSAFRFDRTGEGSVRTIYTFFYNFLIRRLFGVRMRDINFAFKLCRTSIFEHIALHSEGSFIDAELIIRAKKLGYHVIQFGVDYFPRTRGESTLASGSVIRKIVVEMLTLRRELRHLEPIQRGLS